MPTGVYKRDYNKIYTKERAEKISKALKGRSSPRKGKKLSKETRQKISIALKSNTNSKGKGKPWTENRKEKARGENNYAWKGDEVSYRELHKWVNKYKGKPRICEFCGDKAKDWANVSKTYERRLDDFIPLCRSCHIRYDVRRTRLSEKHKKSLSDAHKGLKHSEITKKKISNTLKKTKV